MRALVSLEDDIRTRIVHALSVNLLATLFSLQLNLPDLHVENKSVKLKYLQRQLVLNGAKNCRMSYKNNTFRTILQLKYYKKLL